MPEEISPLENHAWWMAELRSDTRRRAEQRLTPWFPGEVKPARPGVYQQKFKGKIGYQFWNGTRWMAWAGTPEAAMHRMHWEIPDACQQDPWRGLAADPNTQDPGA